MKRIPNEDLKHILKHTETAWEKLDGAQIFFTGGTGFFGIWMLEAMLYARAILNIDFNLTLLSRNHERFVKNYPQFGDQNFISFHHGDITNFEFPKQKFTHIIHGATTSAHETFNNEAPLDKFNTVAEGTRRCLEFAEQCKAKHFWLMSSGSAYGKQPSDMPLMLEDYLGAPPALDANSALGMGKQMAEYLCAVYAKKCDLSVKVARCFSFLGPHLPLDIHYAIGNFIGDGLAGNDIQVKGDGSPIRSYLYMSDLVIWLLTIFTQGKELRNYNVGSEDGRSIADLANLTAKYFDNNIKVRLASRPVDAPVTASSNLYLPSTKRATEELGLKQWISLEESIQKTIDFYQKN